MTTTAEGVETAEQLEWVMAEGCSEAQGHWVGEPLPAVSPAAAWERQRPQAEAANRRRAARKRALAPLSAAFGSCRGPAFGL